MLRAIKCWVWVVGMSALCMLLFILVASDSYEDFQGGLLFLTVALMVHMLCFTCVFLLWHLLRHFFPVTRSALFVLAYMVITAYLSAQLLFDTPIASIIIAMTYGLGSGIVCALCYYRKLDPDAPPPDRKHLSMPQMQR